MILGRADRARQDAGPQRGSKTTRAQLGLRKQNKSNRMPQGHHSKGDPRTQESNEGAREPRARLAPCQDTSLTRTRVPSRPLQRLSCKHLPPRSFQMVIAAAAAGVFVSHLARRLVSRNVIIGPYYLSKQNHDFRVKIVKAKRAAGLLTTPRLSFC